MVKKETKVNVESEATMENVGDSQTEPKNGTPTDSGKMAMKQSSDPLTEKDDLSQKSVKRKGEGNSKPVDDEDEVKGELSADEKIRKLERELFESNEKILRVRAEFENYRKRMQRELSETRSFGKVTTLEEILPIMDHFKMAMAASDSSNDLKTLKEGMKLIQIEFDRCFKNLGIEIIPTTGQQFDPKLHEAVSTEPSCDIEEGCIIKEWKTGYRIGDRLLRPASVVVSSGQEVTKKDSKK